MAKVVGDIAVTVGADISPLKSGLRKGSAEVINFGEKAEQMGRRVQNATKSADKMGGAMGRLSNVSGQTRAKIQNVSYQLQDMAVQFQMGARTSTILAQQLPQLASSFGAVGAAVGVLAGVGIPALSFAFQGAFDEAESFEDSLKGLKEALDSYAAQADLATLSTEEMKERFGSAAEGLRTTLSLLEQISRSEAQQAIDNIAGSLADMMGVAGDGDRRSALADFFDVNIMLAFTSASREARDEARKLTAEFVNAQEALSSAEGDLEQQITAMRRLLAATQDLANAKDGVSRAEQDVIKKMAETLLLLERQRVKVKEVEDSAVDLVEAFYNAYKAIEAQAPALDVLIGKARSLARAAWDYAGAMGSTAVKGGRGGDPRQFTNLDEYRAQLKAQENWKKPGGAGRKKSGGGRSGPDYAKEFEQLKEKFATEAETIQTEYEKQMQMLEEFRARKVAKESEYNELEQRIQQDHATKMAAIERQAQAAKMNAVSGALGDVATLMQTENKKLFKIGQAAAIAEATVSGYQAAVTAWEKGMKIGGPPVAAAFTAASLAKTGALISSIASQSASGSGGAASSGAASGSGVAESGVSRNVAVQLVGGENYGRDQVRDLINMINEETENGAIVRLA